MSEKGPLKKKPDKKSPDKGALKKSPRIKSTWKNGPRKKGTGTPVSHSLAPAG